MVRIGFGRNDPQGEFYVYAGYKNKPTPRDMAALLAAIDAAFAEFAADSGRPNLQLEVIDARIQSIKTILRALDIAGNAMDAVALGTLIGDNQAAAEFVQLAALHLKVAMDSGAIGLLAHGVRPMMARLLGLLAKPVANEQADRAEIGVGDEDVPSVVITNENAPQVIEMARTAGANIEGAFYADDRGNLMIGQGAGAALRRRAANQPLEKLPEGKLGLTAGYQYPADGALQLPVKDGYIRIINPIDGAAPRFDADGLLSHVHGRWEVTPNGANQVPVPLDDAEALSRQLDPDYWYGVSGAMVRVGGRPVSFTAQMIRNGGRNHDIQHDIDNYGLSIESFTDDEVIMRNHRPGAPSRIRFINGDDPRSKNATPGSRYAVRKGIDLSRRAASNFNRIRDWLDRIGPRLKDDTDLTIERRDIEGG